MNNIYYIQQMNIQVYYLFSWLYPQGPVRLRLSLKFSGDLK